MDGILALLLVWQCTRIECGLGSTLYRMLLNVLVDFGVGLIPILGDLFDASFKANTKNVRLLERRLDEVYRPKSGRNEKVIHPATVFEDFSDEEQDREDFVRESRRQDNVQRPDRTATRNDGRGQGGWFSNNRSNNNARDVERGEPLPPNMPPRPNVNQESGTVRGGR